MTEGSLPVSLVWSKVVGELPETAVVSEGMLAISSASLQDVGEYICRGRNEAGESEAFIDIMVSGGLPGKLGAIKDVWLTPSRQPVAYLRIKITI